MVEEEEKQEVERKQQEEEERKQQAEATLEAERELREQGWQLDKSLEEFQQRQRREEKRREVDMEDWGLAVLVAGDNFNDTHNKLKSVMNREGGIMEWAASHNCSFRLEKFQLLNLTRKKVKVPLRP